MTERAVQEPGLATAVAALGRISPPIGTDFRPDALIHAVNILLGLGAEPAARALRVYAETVEIDGDRAILAMRLLFVPRDPAAPIPPPALGKPDTALAQDPGLCPTWPLLGHRDIPFLPIGSFYVGGLGTGAARYLDQCLKIGRLRDHPLVPRTSPLDAAEELLGSPAWRLATAGEEQGRARSMIRLQALNALRHLRDVGDEVRAGLLAADPLQSERAWRAVADDPLLRAARWDVARARFG